jgi:membrane-bound lytic murein transglycosylase D
MIRRLQARVALVVAASALGACTSLPQDPAAGTAMSPAPAASQATGGQDATTTTAEAGTTAAGATAVADPAKADQSTGTVYQPPEPYVAADGSGSEDAASLDEIAQLNLAKRDLWGRNRAGFAMPELDTPLVAQKEKYYLDRPDYLQRMFDRGARYLYYIVEEIEKRGMPTELALLPFVESAMNPVALSSAKAAGLWQFIPSTGKAYDLSQNWWVDNRRDVVQSTRAALDYLQTIYEMHGNDWFLALASYNWGEGAVGRAIKKNKARGKPADYLHLKMPTETRHYVPKLIALKHIVMQADELGLTLPALPDKAYFVTVEKTRPIDLKLAAEFAEMSVADFVALNPAHNRPVIAASKNNVLKIPADKIDAFTAAIARHEMEDKVFASWQPYTLKPGESIDEVARRGGITTAELLRANSISPKVKVLAGTRILAPLKNVEDESLVQDFAGARVYQLVNVPARFHRVKRRETSATIARRYGLTVSQLTAMNGNLSKLRPGASVMVRRATTQTVLVTETGNRQVVKRREPVMVRASSRASSTDSSVETVTLPKDETKRSSKRAVRKPARSSAKPASHSSAARSKIPLKPTSTARSSASDSAS